MAVIDVSLAQHSSSKGRAWLRGFTLTVLFVALLQLLLFISRLLVPAHEGARLSVAAQITAIALAEVLTVFGLSMLLKNERRSLRELGLWRPSTGLAWLLGIGLGLLTALWGLSNPALHLSSRWAAVFDTSLWHLYCALVAGTAAGFCEEILFRGYIMSELAAAGYGRGMQVFGSAVLFGVAHAGLLRFGLVRALLVIVPTAILGALYALICLAGKRSLMPVVASHFLNDFAVIPWIFLAIASHAIK